MLALGWRLNLSKPHFSPSEKRMKLVFSLPNSWKPGTHSLHTRGAACSRLQRLGGLKPAAVSKAIQESTTSEERALFTDWTRTQGRKILSLPLLQECYSFIQKRKQKARKQVQCSCESEPDDTSSCKTIPPDLLPGGILVSLCKDSLGPSYPRGPFFWSPETLSHQAC